jgi:hypothetical protein
MYHQAYTLIRGGVTGSLFRPGGTDMAGTPARRTSGGSHALDGGIGRFVGAAAGRRIAAHTPRAKLAIFLTGSCNGTASRVGGRLRFSQWPEATEILARQAARARYLSCA